MDNPNFNTILREALDAAEKDTVITNADRIRAMSNDELSTWIEEMVYCGTCPAKGRCSDIRVCYANILDWLKSPAADDA